MQICLSDGYWNANRVTEDIRLKHHVFYVFYVIYVDFTKNYPIKKVENMEIYA